MIFADVESSNWMVTPAALALGQTPPQSLQDQRWLFALSGVAVIVGPGDSRGFVGNNPHDWRRDTLFINVVIQPAIEFAITHFGIPRLGDPQVFRPMLSLDAGGWTPFAAVSSMVRLIEALDEDVPVEVHDARVGAAVDRWRPAHFPDDFGDVNGVHLPNLFTGLHVDVAVFGETILHRVSYQATLLGRIVFARAGLPGRVRGSARLLDQ